MKKAVPTMETHPVYLPPLPAWVGQTGDRTAESETFMSGASLAMLHMTLADPAKHLPAALLGNRLALRAAEACLKLEGRRNSEAEIRDAFYLTRAGDEMGPAGEMFARWRGVSAIGLKRKDWLARLKSCLPDGVAQGLTTRVENVGQGSPIAQAATMIALIMSEFPREETAALICGDVVLARALGWAHPLPLLGSSLQRRELQCGADELVLSCHRAVTKDAQNAVRLARDLMRRGERLTEVAPKLRAKGSDAAVQLFLSEDAVLPSLMLAPKIKGTRIAMTDRAARRFCDRLVELGVVRELTGRGTFRLYGVA